MTHRFAFLTLVLAIVLVGGAWADSLSFEKLELDGAYVRHFALESSWLLLADQRGDRILALPWPLSGPTEFVETPVGSPAFILPIGPPRARPVAPGRVVLAAEAHVCRGWRV